MGWSSYNKFGEVVLTADTLDGYSSEDFVFKAGDVLLGSLGVEAIGADMYVKHTGTDQQGHITATAIEFGVSGYDWTLQRTAANVAQLGANDKIRDTSDPVNGNDLARKQYVDDTITTVVSTGAALPTGTLLDFAGAAAPTGFLVCDGSEVSRTTYAALDTVIGTTFGSYTNGAGGAGTTHMRLPDFRGRVSVGAGTGAGDGSSGAAGSNPNGTALSARTRGSWGGGETHALTPAQAPLRAHTHTGTTGTESVSHTHSGTTGNDNTDHSHSGSTGGISANHFHSGTTAGASNNHTHGPGTQSNHMTIDWGANNGGVGFGSGTSAGGVPTQTAGHSADHSHSFSTGFVSSDHGHSFTSGGRSAFHQHTMTTGTTSATHTHTMTTGNPSVAEANGTAHNNVQPFLTVNKIIKT